MKVKKITLFFLCLFLIGGAAAMAARAPQPKNGFPAFWGKCKSAVISRDKKTVAALSSFPIGMSNGVSNIANSGELSRRFGEVFDQDTNAAKCFSVKEPAVDTETPDRYTVTCPNKDDNFVVYEFERTQKEW